MSEEARQHFRRGLTNAAKWFTTANDLMRGAEVLRQQMTPVREATTDQHLRGLVDLDLLRLEPAYLLLAGLALEVRFKALAVARRFGRRHGEDDDSVPAELPTEWNKGAWKNHDLCGLAVLAGADWALDDSDLLIRLTEMVRWRAKYPIPTRPQSVKARVTEEDDMPRIQLMMTRLETEYYGTTQVPPNPVGNWVWQRPD